MPLSILSGDSDFQAYRIYLKKSPESSLWQSQEWRNYQGALGRETRLYGLTNDAVGAPHRGAPIFVATALVIVDRTTFGFSTWDIPRGPLGEGSAAGELLVHVAEEAKRERCMALYFSSPQNKATSYQLPATSSQRGEQPEATLILDLTLTEEELMAQMREKGRYNIRLAQKHGVRVGESKDIDAFYALLRETAGRDGFTILPKRHYECFLKDLPGTFLLLAYSGGELRSKNQELGGGRNLDSQFLIPDSMHARPIAGLLGATWGKTGYYYYGASAYAFRSLMAPYLLQFRAMKLCRSRGCTEYDLLGIAPEGSRTQDSGFKHPWEGLTRFKRQFGGRIETYPPEQMIVLRPVAKAVIEWKRRLIG